MPTYYPSAKVRLSIRLDEFGQESLLQAAPAKPTKNLDGAQPPRGILTVIPDPQAPPGVRSFLITTPGATSASSATSQSRSSDGLTYDITVLPVELAWSRNGFRCAATAQISFRWVDCPIHPMTARSVAVEVFAGCVSAQDYAAGIAGESRGTHGGGLEPLNLIPDQYVDASGKQRTNSRFKGWVDEWVVDWSEDGEPLIHLQCRDNLALLIDQPAPAKLVIDAKGTSTSPRIGKSKPIDEAVAGYLANFNQFQGLSVEWRGPDAPPTLDSIMSNTATRVNVGPQQAGAGGAAGAQTQQMSVLDYLTDVCGALAVGIRMEGDNIILQRPRSAMVNTAPPRVDDPFGDGRNLPGGGFTKYRQFIHGNNVKSMKFHRRLAKNKPKFIEMRCYSPRQKKVLVVRFPLLKDRQDSRGNIIPNLLIPGSAQPEQNWEVIRAYGIDDEKTLRLMAQAHYEQIGRNEMLVEIETKDLASYGGDTIDPDILDMDFGDTFEVLSRRTDDNQNTATRIETMLGFQQTASQQMQSLGFPQDFADAYARAYTNAGFIPQYRMKELHGTFSQDEGMTIRVVGVNYIEVRADKSLDPGEEPGS